MSDKPKGKLAIYWAASCGGCEISILAIDEKILDVAAAFDIVMFPCAADGKVRDVERMPDQAIDVCLFNGGIRTSEQEYMAQLMRRKSKVLVAFGSCASEGCIPGLANMNTRKQVFDTVYKEGSSTATGQSAGRPPAAGDESARGHAAPADLLRHLEDARPDGGGGLLSARLPARGREHLDGHRGDPRRQAAAEGLGDRR